MRDFRDIWGCTRIKVPIYVENFQKLAYRDCQAGADKAISRYPGLGTLNSSTIATAAMCVQRALTLDNIVPSVCRSGPTETTCNTAGRSITSREY